jgi:hypothetical protein
MAATPLTDEERREVDRLLGQWLRRCRVAIAAYNEAAARGASRARRLGATSAALSAIVATAVFATLESDPALAWRIVTGIIAVAAAALAAIQTSLKSTERAEQFRETARGYGRLRRTIERARLFPPDTREEADKLLDALSEEMAEAGRAKPNVPLSVWDRADYKVNGTSDARGLKALRLRVRDRLDFGVRDGAAPKVLMECPECYFTELETADLVALADINTSGSDPDSTQEARRRMRQAAARERDKRPPLDVRSIGNGRYWIIDGHATFAVAQESGWSRVPVRVVPG